MFNIFKSFIHRGVGMVILQILRVFTVIALAAGAAANGVLMVKVNLKNSSYFPFEAASHFFMAVICLVLVFSEFPIINFVKNYFRRSWPLFSDQHGLSWLGIAMLIIGCNLLGLLNEPAFSQKKIGSSLWQLVLAAGILNLTFGCLNAMCSFMWSDRKNGINARDVRSKGAVADGKQHYLPDHYSANGSPASSIRNEKGRSRIATIFWPKDSAGKDTTRPNISGPLEAHRDVERDADDEVRGSPIVPGIKRPDTALHPMNTGRSSRYSTANFSRF